MEMTEAELKELLELYQNAQNMPVIALSVADGLSGKDFASQSQKFFEDKWKSICGKYGLKHNECGFNSQTGEIVQ